MTATLAAGAVAGSVDISLAAAPRALAAGSLPKDRRLGALKDLNGYFPFKPSKSPAEWSKRAEYVRRQMLVASGLWPMPSRPPIEPVVYGKVDRDDYTVEKVYFQSSPGLYVTGSLFRPKGKKGPLPGILCPHGHFSQGRFYRHGDEKMKQELASGGEKYEVSGRNPLQARCVQLTRMGCVVFHYDMLGYADSAPFTRELAHGFGKQSETPGDVDHWGLFSAQSELRLLNSLGLQTFNSVRALDWLSTLPGIDRRRLGITGASGGGTQTFMLMAIDARLSAAFPAVMVSTAMQGGCTCENATYLRVNTGNIEFAALAAPRPIAMSGANDWTRDIETKGLPALRQHYKMLGAPGRVSAKHFDFPHNYNYVSRAMMYEFFNEHFQLGQKSPIIEGDFKPLTVEELSVWNDKHPKPKNDQAAGIAALQALDRDSQKQISQLTPADAKSLSRFRRIVGGALDVMIGRGLPAAGEVEYERLSETPKAGYKEYTSLLRYKKGGEELPTIFLFSDKWNKKVVVWIHESGKAGLYGADGKPNPEVQTLLDRGSSVAAVDLLHQGEFLADGKPLTETRSVANPREFAGYTLGYNHPLFSQRVHDVLSVISFARHHESQPEEVQIIGLGGAAAWVAAACAQAGRAVDRIAVATDGFRFGKVTNIRDLNFLPGAVKYGDLPAVLALCAPTPMWLAGEGKQAPAVVRAAYQAAGRSDGVTTHTGKPASQAAAAVRWLKG